MKTWLRFCAVLATAAVLNACGGIPVSTDYNPDWQLKTPSSYAWLARPGRVVSDTLVDNDLVARRIQRAVNEQLDARGLNNAASEQQADLLVTYHVGEEEKMDVSTFRSNFGYYPCWRCYGPGYYGAGFDSDVWVSYYTQGKLVIDLIDAKTKELVWRGIANRRVPSFKTPVERDAYIRETVAAIFKNFPPR